MGRYARVHILQLRLGAALNVFFPFYVAALVVSAILMVITLPGMDSAQIKARFQPKTPNRLIGGYLAFVGIGLAIFWLIFWSLFAFAGTPTPVATEAFKVVAAVDLTTVISWLVSGGILLWLRKPWGFILATAVSIQGTLYLSVLSLNSFLMIREGLVDFPGELPVWGTLLITMLLAVFILMKNVRVDDAV